MKVVHTRSVAWRRVGDEFIVLDLAERLILGLNPSAGLIWSTLDKPRELHSLTSSVDDSLEHEVIRFVDDLLDRGLLVESKDPAIECDWPRLAEKPEISWQEKMQQVAGTCAFFPSSNPLCNQAPFS